MCMQSLIQDYRILQFSAYNQGKSFFFGWKMCVNREYQTSVQWGGGGREESWYKANLHHVMDD